MRWLLNYTCIKIRTRCTFNAYLFLSPWAAVVWMSMTLHYGFIPKSDSGDDFWIQTRDCHVNMSVAGFNSWSKHNNCKIDDQPRSCVSPRPAAGLQCGPCWAQLGPTGPSKNLPQGSSQSRSPSPSISLWLLSSHLWEAHIFGILISDTI